MTPLVLLFKSRLLLASLLAAGSFAFFAAVAVSLPIWTEAPVVSSVPDQVYASVSGNKVVWQDYRNLASGCPTAQNCPPADIFVTDLSTGIEQKLTDAANGLDPDISGNLAVWRNWATGKIVLYNLATSSLSNVSSSSGAAQQVTPSISGNKVVWVDYRNSINYGDIYMRDLSAPADTEVALGSTLVGDPPPTDTQRDKRNPDIDGNIIAWEDWRNAYQDAQGWWHNPDIYAKDISTGTEYAVTTNMDDQYNPAVSGTKVFWQDYRNGNWDVYMKDLADPSGTEVRVTESNANQSWPSASGDYVVWKDSRNGDEDIYLKKLSTGEELMLNNDPPENTAASQKMPVISGRTAVWMDKRNGNWDIYSAKENALPPVLSNAKVKIYWASYADYQQRLLSVDYRISNSGDGGANDLKIEAVYASNGVTVSTPLPLALGDVAAQASANYTVKYLVPPSVTSFTSSSYVSCHDDDGKIYWFPKEPPNV